MSFSPKSFFTPKSLSRQPSAIRQLFPLLSLPNMISLGGGMPNPSTFPIQSISFTLNPSTTLTLSPTETITALQYSQTQGIPTLLSLLTTLQSTIHQPLYSNWSMCIGNGSQDVLAKALEAFVTENDTIIVEQPTYVGTLSILKSIGCRVLSVETDGDGMVVEGLERVLREESGVKVIYTIPCCSNPSGVTMSVERRRRLVELAKEYDCMVFEDDPYYYLEFVNASNANTNGYANSNANNVKKRLPSLFSMDTEGRIVRFDSFSKTISAGLRIGWVTAHNDVIERIIYHMQSTNLHASGLSQMILVKLLQEWGVDGFLSHVDGVCAEYEKRRNVFLDAADVYLKGLVEWNVPSGGMFVWMRVLGVEDSRGMVEEGARLERVLLLPGVEFCVGVVRSGWVRASYSVGRVEDVVEGVRRFAEVVKRWKESGRIE